MSQPATSPVEIEKCTLVYEHYFNKANEPCGICHLLLGNVCRSCTQEHSHNCPPVTGVCGHSFHSHCLTSFWLDLNSSANFHKEDDNRERNPCPSCQSMGVNSEFQELVSNNCMPSAELESGTENKNN
ncbi:RING-box protein 2 [Tritrichomonas musculus]|uniref:RING-box protein 2 n=1 Tax=Tritrichomonas musculus TaxID=1915356 RepID=A0ABR2H2C2_9EUKA